MIVPQSRKALIFIAIAYGISWAATLAVAMLSPALKSMVWLDAIGIIGAAGPTIAGVICAVFLETRGERIKTLGLRFKPNRWWQFAWLIGIGLSAGSIFATMLVTGRGLADFTHFYFAFGPISEGDWAFAGATLFSATALVLLKSITAALTEEIGWRGYLYHLWRCAGFWRYSLAVGLAWGLWHAPFILLLRDTDADLPLAGLGLLTLTCVLLSPLMTVVRDHGSVVAASILHGAVNAMSAITVFAVAGSRFPWGGFFGFGGCAVLTVVCLLMLRPALAPLADRR